MKVKKFDAFYTKDGVHLCEALRLYHRTKDIKPEWEQYASYVHVVSLEMGDDFYLPTDFIAGRDPETDHVILAVPMQEVERRTWTRMPDFILHQDVKVEVLTEAEKLVE